MQTGLTYSPMYAKAIDGKTRSVEAVLSSETIDAYGDIVDQGSWNLRRYLLNPVVLRMHRMSEVIGHAENVRVVAGKLQAQIVFATTALADEVFTLFKDGAMRAFSVGFRPGRIMVEKIDGREINRLLDCELLEVSAVSIPANPDAIVKHKSLGLLPSSYEASCEPSLALLAAVRERTGKAPVLPQTGDAAADLFRQVELNIAYERGAQDSDDSDPFDFGGAA